MAERITIIDFVEKYSHKYENYVYLRDKIDAELFGLFPTE